MCPSLMQRNIIILSQCIEKRIMINTKKNNALFVCGIKISPPIGWASKGSSNEAIYDGSG